MCIGQVTIGRKSGTFVGKSRHKKWNQKVRTVFPKNSSDTTVTQVQQQNVQYIWLNELKFCEISRNSFQTDAESFSFLSWKTKKFYS